MSDERHGNAEHTKLFAARPRLIALPCKMDSQSRSVGITTKKKDWDNLKNQGAFQ